MSTRRMRCDERDDDPQAGIDGLLVLAESLDDAPLVRARTMRTPDGHVDDEHER